jgi:DNA mismatch repair protein MSH4
MTKTALSARTSRVFAIKAERKRLLDVARETYKENINDVDELLKELQTKYPELLDDVELAYAATSGFTFTIHEAILMEKTAGTLELPREFTKSGKKGRKIVFSCVDLVS